MTEGVYVNAAKDKIVEFGPEAAYRIHRKDAERLGLLKDEPKANKIVEPDAPVKRTYTRRAIKTDDE